MYDLITLMDLKGLRLFNIMMKLLNVRYPALPLTPPESKHDACLTDPVAFRLHERRCHWILPLRL